MISICQKFIIEYKRLKENLHYINIALTGKWKLASKAAVTTVNASVGSGLWVIFYSYVLTNKFQGKLDICTFTSCILGGLVSITAGCAVIQPWEALIIGIVGGIITSYGKQLLSYKNLFSKICYIADHSLYFNICDTLFFLVYSLVLLLYAN